MDYQIKTEFFWMMLKFIEVFAKFQHYCSFLATGASSSVGADGADWNSTRRD